MASTIEPRGYLRQVLAHDERILFETRQHSLFLFGHVFWWLLIALVILVGVTGLLAAGAAASAGPGVSMAYGLLVVPLAVIWWRWLVWSNHVFVITTRRVVQLSGVLGKEVVDSSLEKVNDVKTEQSLLGRMFGYGDVEILTASETGENQFRHVADPLGFKRAMLDAKDELEREIGGN
jgi:uncharacterized membrane protein YdbT with pleckstrin-like domain